MGKIFRELLKVLRLPRVLVNYQLVALFWLGGGDRTWRDWPQGVPDMKGGLGDRVELEVLP